RAGGCWGSDRIAASLRKGIGAGRGSDARTSDSIARTESNTIAARNGDSSRSRRSTPKCTAAPAFPQGAGAQTPNVRPTLGPEGTSRRPRGTAYHKGLCEKRGDKAGKGAQTFLPAANVANP